jgi:hypothetical protein
MTLSEFVNVLLSVTPSVYQDEANQEPDEYIVWTMLSDKTFRADNLEAECAVRINVRIFTTRGQSEIPGKLKTALMKNDIAYEDFEYEYINDMKYGIYSTFCEVD